MKEYGYGGIDKKKLPAKLKITTVVKAANGVVGQCGDSEMEIKIVGNTNLDLYLGIIAEGVTTHGIAAEADLIVEKILKRFDFFIE